MVTVILINNQVSPALGIRMGYVYMALPISGLFITLYGIEFIIQELRLLVAGREEVEEEAPALKATLD